MPIETFPNTFAAHLTYRRIWNVASWCYGRGLRRSARFFELLFRVLFSADVPPHLRLPADVVLMHNALGTVIHAETEFRGPAVVHQNVTIGKGEGDGVPSIGSRVFIGAGATVVGPIRVGDNVIISANCLVSRDVPDGHLVTVAKTTIRPIAPGRLDAVFGKPHPERTGHDTTQPASPARSESDPLA